MNKKSAKNVKEFAVIISNTDKQVIVRVPGHEGRKYDVAIKRGKGFMVSCTQVQSFQNPKTAFKTVWCKGNYKTVCYHSIAAVEVLAESKGHKVVAWCDTKEAAKRVARLHSGSYFTRVSTKGSEKWLVGVAPKVARKAERVEQTTAEVEETYKGHKVSDLYKNAQRYVELYNLAQSGQGSWFDEEYKKLNGDFTFLNWNHSMILNLAEQGKNTVVEVK